MSANNKIKTNINRCIVCGAKPDEGREVGRGIDFEYDTCSNEFGFISCHHCEHLYINPIPDESELGTIYPENYGNFDPNRNKAMTFKVKNWIDKRYIKKMTKNTNINTVLDVGCADGRLLEICKDIYPKATLEGVEFSDDFAEHAIKKGYKVHVGSIDSLALPSNHYDLIFLQQVIEHVYEPVKVINNLYNCLKPGGIICFEMPTSEAIDRKFGEKRYWAGYHIPRHFNFFNEKNFSEICQEVGFDVVSVVYRYQPPHWVGTVHHYLQEKDYPFWIYKHFNMKNTFLIVLGTVLEVFAKLISGKASNMQIIVQKKN